MGHTSGRCMPCLGTKAKCQSKSLKIEDMIVCGMWQITVIFTVYVTKGFSGRTVKTPSPRKRSFWNLVYGHFMPCGGWGQNSSAVLLAQLMLKFRNLEHFDSIWTCFFVSVWNHSSVATTIIIKLFLLSHTVKSEFKFCSCPLGVYHWKQCVTPKKCDNENFRWFPVVCFFFFWSPSLTLVALTQLFYTLAEICPMIYVTSEGNGVI